jgi:hypothetical protein
VPVRIVRHESHTEPVKTEILISTIETNRDRIRTLGNMLISMSAILIPACLAFLLFLADKNLIGVKVAIFLVAAILSLLISSCLSILSSYFRSKFAIRDEVHFVEDLLKLLNSELRMSYFSFAFLLLGMVSMILGVLIFVIGHWR